jgi:cytochrome b
LEHWSEEWFVEGEEEERSSHEEIFETLKREVAELIVLHLKSVV